MVSFTDPDGTQTDPEWFGDVDDSAPDPDSGSDGYTYEDPTNDPESEQYEPPNLDFGDDIPDDSGGSDPSLGSDSGLLSAAGTGAAGLAVGLLVAGVAVLGGD